MVTPATKLSHEYKEFVTNTTASTKQRDHHQDSDSDNDDILSELSSPGNKKVPPFYPPIQGRSDDSPVTDNPKTNIMELHLDNGDDLKYISQFRLSRETVIDQKHHYPLLVYVQQLHNKIALLEHNISLNNSSISGYKDSSLATTVYTRRRDIVASITSSHATEVVGEIFHTRKFCHTQVSSCTHLNLLESPCF